MSEKDEKLDCSPWVFHRPQMSEYSNKKWCFETRTAKGVKVYQQSTCLSDLECFTWKVKMFLSCSFPTIV